MEERLRTEKPVHAAPSGFVDRVMANLPKAERAEASTPERGGLLWLRFALGTAAVVIAAVIAIEVFSPNQVPTSRVQRAATAATPLDAGPDVATADVSIDALSPEQLQALTMKLDEPLEQELKNVISDTRLAIQFVASNFLPEK